MSIPNWRPPSEAPEHGRPLRRHGRLRLRVPVPPDLYRRRGKEGHRRAQGPALARRGRQGGAGVQGVRLPVEARLPGALVSFKYLTDDASTVTLPTKCPECKT